MTTRRKQPAVRRRNPASKNVPVPGTPSELHNPAVTAAFKRKGFHIVNTGGGIMAYTREDKTIGEVLVNVEGYLPLSMKEVVDVHFLGNQHSEALLTMSFPSVRAFLARVVGGE